MDARIDELPLPEQAALRAMAEACDAPKRIDAADKLNAWRSGWSAWLALPEDDDRRGECASCGDRFDEDDTCKPTPFCHYCAQEVTELVMTTDEAPQVDVLAKLATALQSEFAPSLDGYSDADLIAAITRALATLDAEGGKP